MTTDPNARSEARNRLMSLGIGLLFIGPVLQLQAADIASVRADEEVRGAYPRRTLTEVIR